MKLLKPIVAKESWAKGLDKRLRGTFATIYLPMLDMIDAEKHNAKDASILMRALKAGTVRYKGGWFSGEMSAKLSKEIKELGGQFNRSRRAWYLPAVKLPPTIMMEASRSEDRFSRLFDGLLDVASDANKRVMAHLETDAADFEAEGDEIAEAVSEAFAKTTAAMMSVQPKIEKDIRKHIDKTVTDTKTKPIRKVTVKEAAALREKMGTSVRVSAVNFSDEETARLRRELEVMIRDGRNIKAIRDYVQGRLNVSKKRAAFIAMQETRLFTSALSVAKHKEVGVTRYIWQANGDSRTRDLHMANDGHTFAWDEAPIGPNEKGNPGEAFGCRCVAVPIHEGY